MSPLFHCLRLGVEFFMFLNNAMATVALLMLQTGRVIGQLAVRSEFLEFAPNSRADCFSGCVVRCNVRASLYLGAEHISFSVLAK